MRNNTLFNGKKNKLRHTDNTLKQTALLYLREALRKDEYEDCAELIKNAKRFGALQAEITQLIASHIAGEKEGLQNEANNKGGNRLRF